MADDSETQYIGSDDVEVLRTAVVPFGYEDQPADIQQYLILAKRSEMERLEGKEASEAIAAKILSAATEDEIFANQTTEVRDILGRAFVINSLDWQISDKYKDQEGAFPVYAVLHVKMLDSGEETVVTCGARNVMAQAYKLQELVGWPSRPVKFASRTTGSGNDVYYLNKAV
jgi:hypothetical protein